MFTNVYDIDTWQSGRAVVGTVGALVRSADFANTQNVERGRVESPDEESLRSQGFHDNRLPGAREVCHRVVPPVIIIVMMMILIIIKK